MEIKIKMNANTDTLEVAGGDKRVKIDRSVLSKKERDGVTKDVVRGWALVTAAVPS